MTASVTLGLRGAPFDRLAAGAVVTTERKAPDDNSGRDAPGISDWICSPSSSPRAVVLAGWELLYLCYLVAHAGGQLFGLSMIECEPESQIEVKIGGRRVEVGSNDRQFIIANTHRRALRYRS